MLKALEGDKSVAEALYIGSSEGLEKELIANAGYEFEGLDVSGLPRKISISGASSLYRAIKAVGRARAILKGFKPDVVVGTGAYVSVPVVLAAASMGVPTVIHEQNAIPGLANRALGRLASGIAISFEETRRFFPRKPVELTGNPVREDILTADRASARRALNLDPEGTVVLIFGGSRGARRLNDAAIGGAEKLLKYGIDVIHSAGSADYERVKGALAGLIGAKYAVFPYITDMASAYAAADLVVSRSGASTVAEITARGLASLLVPYPYATGRHQEANARILESAGAAKVVTDEELTPERLVAELGSLLMDRRALDRMKSVAKKLGKPDAAPRLAALVKRTAAARAAASGR